jgi:hypothetical protein
MAGAEFLLLALAVLYFVVPDGHSSKERRNARVEKQNWRNF